MELLEALAAGLVGAIGAGDGGGARQHVRHQQPVVAEFVHHRRQQLVLLRAPRRAAATLQVGFLRVSRTEDIAGDATIVLPSPAARPPARSTPCCGPPSAKHKVFNMTASNSCVGTLHMKAPRPSSLRAIPRAAPALMMWGSVAVSDNARSPRSRQQLGTAHLSRRRPVITICGRIRETISRLHSANLTRERAPRNRGGHRCRCLMKAYASASLRPT